VRLLQDQTLALVFLLPLARSDISRSRSPMSSALSTPSPSTNFQILFDAALAKYTKCTGKDLRDHSLAFIIDRCESPDAILDIIQEQSQALDEFRNGNPKLIESLAPVVKGLHAISTNAILNAGASLVSHLAPPEFQIPLSTVRLPLDVSPCKSHIFWNCCPPVCACHIASSL
jgi:hypothetical protein